MYVMSMILCHKMYGDPRGRGCRGRVIELFLTWRLSIIYRIRNKLTEAEYVEEIFDAVLCSLGLSDFNQYYELYSELESKQFGIEK